MSANRTFRPFSIASTAPPEPGGMPPGKVAGALAVGLATLALFQGCGGGDSSPTVTNLAPTASLPADPFHVSLWDTTTVYLDAYVKDAEGDQLSFSAMPGPAWLTISKTGVITAIPDVRAYHEGIGQLVVIVSDGRHEVRVAVRFEPTTSAKWSATYGRPKLALGKRIELLIDDMDEPEIWMDSVRVTNNALLEYDAAWCAGRLISAAVESSNTNTNLYIDHAPVAVGGGYRTGLACVDSTATWVRIRPASQDASLECLPSGDINVRCNVTLPYIPKYMVAGRNFHVLGRNLASGNYRLDTYSNIGTLLSSRQSATPIFIAETPLGNRTVTVTGATSLETLFWAIEQLVGNQFGEPFAGGNDFLGRLGNNQAERLWASVLLFERWPDPALHAHIVGAVSRILGNADPNGLFFSTKYSLTQQSEIAFGVDVMALHDSILSAHSLLGSALANKAIDAATKALQHYESDWATGRYLLPSCTNMQYDGIVAPMNFQSRWGAVALRLYELTGRQQFLDRAAAIYIYVSAQMEWLGATRAWHYWPLEFYSGWDSSKYRSCNVPSAAATQDEYFDDYSHALATVEFLATFERATGRPPVIDVEALAERLHADGNRFYFSFGKVPGEAAERYLPYGYWARTAEVAPYYKSLVVLPIPDYDAQLVFQAQVRAASRARESPGDQLRLEVGTLDDLGESLLPEEIVLTNHGDHCELGEKRRSQAAGGCAALLREWFEAFLPQKRLEQQPYPSTLSSPAGE